MKFSKISTKFSKDLAKISKISHQTCRFASKITKGKVKSAPNHKGNLNIHELFAQKIDLNIHQIYSINQGSLRPIHSFQTHFSTIQSHRGVPPMEACPEELVMHRAVSGSNLHTEPFALLINQRSELYSGADGEEPAEPRYQHPGAS